MKGLYYMLEVAPYLEVGPSPEYVGGLFLISRREDQREPKGAGGMLIATPLVIFKRNRSFCVSLYRKACRKLGMLGDDPLASPIVTLKQSVERRSPV
jgi:hypothetical protein